MLLRKKKFLSLLQILMFLVILKIQNTFHNEIKRTVKTESLTSNN